MLCLTEAIHMFQPMAWLSGNDRPLRQRIRDRSVDLARIALVSVGAHVREAYSVLVENLICP